MTKITKIAVIILFVVSLAACVLSGVRYYRTLDSQAPEITMDKDTVTVSVKSEDSEILKGITAKDDRDGDVTECLIVEKMSKIDSNSTRKAIIAAFDGRGNIGRSSRIVKYTDYTHPRFSLEGPLRVPVESDISYATKLVSASDCLDGNISGKVSFEYEKPEDDFKVGDYPITIEVVNSAGDKQSINATVTFCDPSEEHRSTSIELTDYIVYTNKDEEIDPYDYIDSVRYNGREYEYTEGAGNFGSDTIGRDESTIGRDSIIISGDIDYSKAGSQEITYTVNDDRGVDNSVRLIVVVED